ETVRTLGISEAEIKRIVAEETAELQRQQQRFRDDHPAPTVQGRTVMLVDDGLATGVTAYAAIQWVRRLNPEKIVFACPVCAAQTAQSLGREVDSLVCGITPQNLGAVGLWFEDFGQTSDEEVVELLRDAER